jgi:hypothetical protein
VNGLLPFDGVKAQRLMSAELLPRYSQWHARLADVGSGAAVVEAMNPRSDRDAVLSYRPLMSDRITLKF